MKAIVLAGGFGTRIQPLTNSMPKPMLPILNRPMMEHIIIKLRDDLGIKDIAVLLYFKPEIIKDYFRDGKDFGVNITYFKPDDDYGTAGAVGFAREFLDETFIIVSGDLVTDFNFPQIADFHKKKNSKLTIALTPVENPLQFGVVIANEENKIEKFLEKPSWGEVFSDTINTGIYLIEPEILDYIPIESNFDFAQDLFPLLMKEGIDLWGCPIEGYWRDVGNPQSYREVYQDIFNGEIKLPFKGERKEFENGIAYIDEGTTLPELIRINGLVVLGKNITIKGGVSLDNVVVGDNSYLGEHVELDNCTIWNDTQIEYKSVISKAVICNNNKFGKNVKAKHGLIIAENCEVGDKASFEKDVIVWTDKTIDKSAVISNNIIWGGKYKSSIFQAGSVIGSTNIELSCEMATKLAEAFGSTIKKNSKIYISRDYHKSSRMLKRAFLGGMLSTGINVIDLEIIPSNVMRHSLAKFDEIYAGVHLRQSLVNPNDTEIIFYTSEGLTIDTNFTKSIERIFFRENFRRVTYTDIGDIEQPSDLTEDYIKDVQNTIDTNLFKKSKLKVAVDIMFGSTASIYPRIANSLAIDNIILNAYKDDKKLSNLSETIITSQENMSIVVKSMGLDCGFLIYPNGQRMQTIANGGERIDDYILLLVVLELLNKTAKEKTKVFLPAWAPDFVEYENLDIVQNKFANFKASELQEYICIADTDGGFSFTEFGLNKDAIYASFKVLELLKKADTTFSEIVTQIPSFAYRGENIHCQSKFKGKMMRKFMEDAKGKKYSNIDGVKIWLDDNSWILMVPDEYSDFLNIYIQANNETQLQAIFDEYNNKITDWINE